MPALPTSLIVVGLVAAWLVVLVPMVARRREHVPDSDDGTRGFRVLRRASRSLRRRPVLSRTAVAGGQEDLSEDGSDDSAWDSDELDGEQGNWSDNALKAGDGDPGDGDADDGDAADETARDDTDQNGQEDMNETSDEMPPDAYPAPRDRSVGEDRTPTPSRRAPIVHDAADEWAAEHAPGRHGVAAVEEPQDDTHYRPVPVRHGRGGFDPQAAEQARTYRFRQRRRVALVLLAVALLAAGVGLLGVTLAWVAAVAAAVLLALYLAYLRRQVRIEESIRRRRASRMERARQIRPVYRASVAEQVRAHRDGSRVRPGDGDDSGVPYRVTSHARPSSTVPPAYRTPGVPVDLDDDDPAFDDLEYYRPAVRRRAVGE